MTSLRGSRAKKAVCSHWTHTIKPLLVGLPEGRRTKSLKYDRLWCRGGDLMDIPHTRVQKSFGQTGRKVKIGRGHRKGLRDCRILRRCSMSPNPQLCQRGAMRQRMGEGNTPGGVSPHSQGAWLALRLVRQGDGLHYPVGQPLFGDSLPFLLSSVADKELLRASDAPGAVHVYAQCSYGTQQR